MTNAIMKLKDFGQSCWLDNLTRGKIVGGELKRRVSAEGVRGVTSNPAIFSKAISAGSEYDDQIRRLVNEAHSLQEIYETLVIQDIQDACDILRPVYEESHGEDGFVSLEVSPYLAHDAEGTLNEARHLFAAVARPNCLIKIPGTPACVPVIEQCLYEGINVNITLLFSIESYEQVACAYVRALERRCADGQPVERVASVASFFLSRIDVLVDQLLGHRIRPQRAAGGTRPEHLFGKAAVASAKLAYQSFRRIFSGEQWEALREKGARVQKPLWASTSTKDPLYSDICYVQPLIGACTVNTMPEETIAAFADHGLCDEATIEKDLEEARRAMDRLDSAGIDIGSVTRQLVDEGIQKFIDPFDKLMKILVDKRERFLAGSSVTQSIAYGAFRTEAVATLGSLNSKQFARRFAAGDPHLWTGDPRVAEGIRSRLGWMDCVERFRPRILEIARFAQEVRESGIRSVVLLGMGGSSLCPEVCQRTFGSQPGWPGLIVLDNTDPAAVRRILAVTEPSTTLFVVASKSGTTTETGSFCSYFYHQMKRKLGADEVGSHFVAITDPGTPLAEQARRQNFRYLFENPADIGGRYAALSYFGLVPMALMGMDVEKILASAGRLALSCGSAVPVDSNPAAGLGVFLAVNRRQGRDKATFVLPPALDAFGPWVEQLIAESTGKQGMGIVPVTSEALGGPEDYGKDRVFIYVSRATGEARAIGRRLAALEGAGHPVARIELRDLYDLGGEFLRWELATAAAGALMGVNPFDEPNVAESKNNTRQLLSEWMETGNLAVGEPILVDEGVAVYADETAAWLPSGNRDSLTEFLGALASSLRPPDYVALLAYMAVTAGRTRRLQSARMQFRNRLRVATTLAYGPRYLHSTGQLHKGGAADGMYLMVTADAGRDAPIPGEKYGFLALQRAQALGDYRALAGRGRRVIRLHLGGEIEKGLEKLVAASGAIRPATTPKP